jgi:hypothetical protein
MALRVLEQISLLCGAEGRVLFLLRALRTDPIIGGFFE